MHRYLFLFVVAIMLPFSSSCHIKGRTSITSELDKFHLDNEITQHLIKYGQYLPLIDLGFAVGELCQAFREHALLKDELIENVRKRRNYEMSRSDAAFWEMEDKFFRSRLRANKAIAKEFSKEIESIEKELPIINYNNPITDEQIREAVEKASEAYGISEASTGALNLLVYEGDRMVRIIQDSQALTSKYRRWLSEMHETGIYAPWTSYDILERKENYILEKYKTSINGLMKETLDVIRNTDVIFIR
jgi:hypothetical protein